MGYDVFGTMTFYSEDGTTELEQTVDDLCGHSFKGTNAKMIRGSYTVTHVVDGGSESAPVQSIVGEGYLFIVSSCEGTKEGYTFRGWTDGVTVYESGSEYTVGTSDITLIAVWNLSSAEDMGVRIAGAALDTIAVVMATVLYGRRATF